MILRRVILHNYRQHADVDQKLDGTLIAVVGPNGSGKSNLLGSIQFAFTGEQAGFKKSDLLRWGQDEGEVIVEFEHNGTAGRITRALHSSGAVLQFGDEVFRGATNVTEALKLHLELDKDLLKQAVFVRQAEIDAILFTDPRVRELSFQRLMGIGDAAKIHKTLGDLMSEMGEPPNYDEQIADGKKRWAELHTRLLALQSQLLALKAQRAQVPGMDIIKAMMAEKHTQVQQLQRLNQLSTAWVQSAHEIAGAQSQLNSLPQPVGDLAQFDADLKSAQQQYQALQAYQTAFERWKAAGEAVLQLGTCTVAPEALQEAKANYDKITAEINRLLGRHKLHKDLMTVIEKTGECTECPVCGNTVADIAQLKLRLTRIIAGIEVEGMALRTAETQAQTTFVKMTSTKTAFDNDLAARVAVYNQADKLLRATPEVKGDLVAITAQINDLDQKRKTLIATVTQRTRAESLLKACTDQVTRNRDAVIEAAKVGVSLGLPIQADGTTPAAMYPTLIEKLNMELASWEQQRDVLQQLDNELSRLDGVVTELTTSMMTLDKTVAALEYKRGMQAGYKEVIATIQRVRDWFHYSNGPHTLSTSVLGSLNQDVNKFLGQFTAPFTVEPSSDALGFRCYFTDGRAMPAEGAPDASMLSGGQKIQLAVAFRFATYCMFASKLGLLSLDEPTAYLDDQNVGRFGDLLQQIKRVAQGMNLQVLMATHERSVMPFMDTVIDLAEK